MNDDLCTSIPLNVDMRVWCMSVCVQYMHEYVRVCGVRCVCSVCEVCVQCVCGVCAVCIVCGVCAVCGVCVHLLFESLSLVYRVGQFGESVSMLPADL